MRKLALFAVAFLSFALIGCGEDAANTSTDPSKAALENKPLNGGKAPGTLTPGAPGAAQEPGKMGLPGNKGG